VGRQCSERVEKKYLNQNLEKLRGDVDKPVAIRDEFEGAAEQFGPGLAMALVIFVSKLHDGSAAKKNTD
jgi:hypothetical protein